MVVTDLFLVIAAISMNHSLFEICREKTIPAQDSRAALHPPGSSKSYHKPPRDSTRRAAPVGSKSQKTHHWGKLLESILRHGNRPTTP